VAVLVGVEQDHAALWQIFSNVAKQQQTIPLSGDRKDQKALYSFHEAIVNALRPTLKEGVKSVIVASPPRTTFGQEFLSHIKSHHQWLMQGTNKAIISQIIGSASTKPQVAALTSTTQFKELIQENASEETENLVEILEKRLNTSDNLVLFSLQEAENMILSAQIVGKPQPEYLLLTDEYIACTRQRGRLHRLMQVAQNRGFNLSVLRHLH